MFLQKKTAQPGPASASVATPAPTVRHWPTSLSLCMVPTAPLALGRCAGDGSAQCGIKLTRSYSLRPLSLNCAMFLVQATFELAQVYVENPLRSLPVASS